MKKKFKIEIDCAACAAKVENAISKLEGVENVNVNFMAQKMSLEAADDVFDDVLERAVKAAKRVEPDFAIER